MHIHVRVTSLLSILPITFDSFHNHDSFHHFEFDEIGNLIYSHLFIAACLQFTCDAKHNSFFI